MSRVRAPSIAPEVTETTLASGPRGLSAAAVASADATRRAPVTRPRRPYRLRAACRPRLLGDYDFELLERGVGKACIERDANERYWIGPRELAEITTDRLARRAIAAAALDAISRLQDADTILLTSVVTESEGDDQMCARVVGRGRAARESADDNRADTGARLGR